MEFNINKIKKVNFDKYENDSIKIARDFTTKIYKELGDIIKIVVLFGSSARQDNTSKPKDIDILIVLDDVTLQWPLELVEAYRLMVEKTIASVCPDRLHITTLKLTTFWEYLKNSDPIAINILRDGISLIDHDIFDPIQALLYQGRIRPSYESIYIYYGRAPKALMSAQNHLLEATKDLYWSVIDCSHAALMTQNLVPASPNHVSNMISEHLVKKGLIEKEYAQDMNFFYTLMKKIEHREIQHITGKEFDEYYKKAKNYVVRMDKFISEQISKTNYE